MYSCDFSRHSAGPPPYKTRRVSVSAIRSSCCLRRFVVIHRKQYALIWFRSDRIITPWVLIGLWRCTFVYWQGVLIQKLDTISCSDDIFDNDNYDPLILSRKMDCGGKSDQNFTATVIRPTLTSPKLLPSEKYFTLWDFLATIIWDFCFYTHTTHIMCNTGFQSPQCHMSDTTRWPGP